MSSDADGVTVRGFLNMPVTWLDLLVAGYALWLLREFVFRPRVVTEEEILARLEIEEDRP